MPACSARSSTDRPARSSTASPSCRSAATTIEDPAAWEQQMLAERAVRDETRAEYLAPARHPVRITRVATRGKTQVREVADYLASSGLAARPELVYGAYRVPDLISPGRLGGEKGAIVEWDVVHAADGPLPPAEPPRVVSSTPSDVLVVRARRRARARSTRTLRSTSSRAPASGPSGRSAIARDVTHPQGRGGDDDNSQPRDPRDRPRRAPARRRSGSARAAARRTVADRRRAAGRRPRSTCSSGTRSPRRSIPSASSGRRCRRRSRTSRSPRRSCCARTSRSSASPRRMPTPRRSPTTARST